MFIIEIQELIQKVNNIEFIKVYDTIGKRETLQEQPDRLFLAALSSALAFPRTFPNNDAAVVFTRIYWRRLLDPSKLSHSFTEGLQHRLCRALFNNCHQAITSPSDSIAL